MQYTRIMSANVLRSNKNYHIIIDEIERQNPDIFISIEHTKNLHKALQSSEIKNKYQNNHNAFTIHNKKEDGIGIYSKLPIKIEEELFNKQVILTSTTTNNQKLYIIVVHIENPLSPNRKKLIRKNQFKAIIEKIKKHNHLEQIPLMIIGDLNSTQYSFLFSHPLQKFELKNAQTGFKHTPTWSPLITKYAKYLGLQIDHALHTKEIKIHNFSVGNFIKSDHRPIIVDFSVKKAGE